MNLNWIKNIWQYVIGILSGVLIIAAWERINPRPATTTINAKKGVVSVDSDAEVEVLDRRAKRITERIKKAKEKGNTKKVERLQSRI